MDSKSILLRESNIISLRTAYITDIGNLVELRLQHADLASKLPTGRKWWAPKDFDWVKHDSAWLYRYLRPPDEELKLKNSVPTVEVGVKPMSFEIAPKFTVIWTDSGHSVAVCLNGEPWAFIDESSHQGYSKGVVDAEHAGGNPWDQQLFDSLFGRDD